MAGVMSHMNFHYVTQAVGLLLIVGGASSRLQDKP